MQYAFSTDGAIRMLEKLFGFDSKHHSMRTEITADVTTFLTMAYILAVNPSIFAPLAEKGMPTGAVFTATALAAVGTLVTLGKLSAPSTLLAMAGFLLMSVHYIRRVRGALLYGNQRQLWQASRTPADQQGWRHENLVQHRMRELGNRPC